MMMTNAERQKRYRDRKRGGPPVGRWAGGVSVAFAAKEMDVGRTIVFMNRWIDRHAPDIVPILLAGGAKTTPTYNRLRAEYNAGILAAFRAKPDHDGFRLTESRKNGKFVFRWVRA
jgi:hypothetical protein